MFFLLTQALPVLLVGIIFKRAFSLGVYEPRFESVKDLLRAYSGEHCYVKGKSIGSGRYSNVYISWKVDFSTEIREKMGFVSVIDPTLYDFTDNEISVLRGVPVAIKELKTVQEWKILREISILRLLNGLEVGDFQVSPHLKEGKKSIIQLLDVVSYQNQRTRTEGKVRRDKRGIERGDFERKKSLGLVLEYVENKPFFSLLPRLSYQDLCNYMRQLIRGLGYANSMGVFHRDIKPQNIIINEKSKELKIIDWGLAEYLYLETDGDFSPRVASKHYKAPELLLGLRKYNFSVDSWSLGCLFSQMLFRLGTFRTNFFTRVFSSFPQNFVGVFSQNSPSPDTLFPGWDNDDQLIKIASLLGGDNLESISTKYNGKISDATLVYLRRTKKTFSTTKPWFTDPRTFEFLVTRENSDLVTVEALDLLSKLLTLDFKYRILPIEALEHPFFASDPSSHRKISDFGREESNPYLLLHHCLLEDGNKITREEKTE
ncbi:putative casein kinase [Cryptosporidium felis]|nr:putative casein kinase [Cryptosporidium felis]